MRPVRLAAVAFAMAMGLLMCSDGVQSQEKKDAPKVKGQLPPGWKALDLSEEQKLGVYKVQTEYREKITKLEEEIKKLRTEQTKKMSEVLTADQKKKLIDAIAGEKKEEPKKAPPKKEDK